MTLGRIQHCLKKLGIDLSHFNGDRVFPRTVTNRDIALYIYNNHFSLIWKSRNVKFNDAIEELKDNFKIFDIYISNDNVKSFIKYEFTPKKIESHLTNFIVYDLETLNTDRARPYNMTLYRLSKFSGRYDGDPTKDELEKSIKDTISFAGDNCISTVLIFLLKYKGEERKVNNKIVEYSLQLHAHNGSVEVVLILG